MTTRRAARIAAALLVTAAAGLVVGSRIESAAERTEPTHTGPEVEESAEAAEAGGHDEGAEEAERGEATAESHDDSDEERTILGLDPEAPGPVLLAVLTSMALAVGLWRTQRRSIAIAGLAFAAVFAALDFAEVAHQLDEGRTGLSLAAAAIAIGHAVAALGAGRAAFRP